jgi:hypothetical protein
MVFVTHVSRTSRNAMIPPVVVVSFSFEVGKPASRPQAMSALEAKELELAKAAAAKLS